ncbi:MAG: DciA family protein [Alphaproteobacteria bacterium]|nr:DciA family protein [Alphaproteobacteria bacterium]
MKPLVKITENIVERRVSRLGAIQTHIFLNWKNIAGQYADVTFPDKIKFDKKKNHGQIIMKVQNGFGPEIQHAIPFLLNQINSRFGYKAITKIKIIQTDLGYIHISTNNDKMLKNSLIDKQNLISSKLPDGELKLAMQKFEISRKQKNKIIE